MKKCFIVSAHKRKGKPVKQHIRCIQGKKNMKEGSSFDWESRGAYSLSKSTFSDSEISLLNNLQIEFERQKEELLESLAEEEGISLEEFKADLESGERSLKDWGIPEIRDARHALDHTGALLEGVQIKEVGLGYDSSGLYIDVTSDKFEMKRVIKDGEVENVSFQLNDRTKKGNGIGTKVLANQVAELESEGGVYAISTRAEGDFDRIKVYNGYYTWPRLGYEMNPRFSIMADYTSGSGWEFDEFTGEPIETFDQLFETQEGRDWWKRNGETFSAVFWLSSAKDLFEIKGKTGTRRLNDYLWEKGYPRI